MKYVELEECKERVKELWTTYHTITGISLSEDLTNLFQIAKTALTAWENQSALLAEAEEEIKRLRGK